MECPKHLGREMEPIYTEARLCGACEQPMPIKQTGWRCAIDGSQYTMDGNDIPVLPPVEEIPVVTPVEAMTPVEEYPLDVVPMAVADPDEPEPEPESRRRGRR